MHRIRFRSNQILACATAILAAAQAGPRAHAQPHNDPERAATMTAESVRSWQAIENQRLTDIENEIAQNGPYSIALFDMYFSLASHYREIEDDVLASEALAQALHIQRVNSGLFSLDQAPVTRELIANLLATGQLEEAVQLEERLVRIARENITDIRAVPILEAAADRQVDVYERYLAGELPPEMNVSFGVGDADRWMNTNRFIGMSNLFAARRNYRDAVQVLLGSGNDTDPRIVEIEQKLIRSYFIEATSEGTRASRSAGLFRLGRDSYSRILRYAVAADDIDIAAEGMIGLADWHLLFQRFGSALQMYADAYQALVQLGASRRQLERIFAPEVPIALPTFNPNPLDTTVVARNGSAEAYVDVRMRLSRYGRSRSRYVETTAGRAEKLLEKEIRSIIVRNRFRPRLVNGEPQHGSEVEFRYYFDSEQS
jgi:tetratricopeptide (TPR) repeat protein